MSHDNWLYAQNLSRGTGKRWTYLYTPRIDIFGDRDKDLRRYSYLYNADSVLSNNSYQYDLTNRQSINNAFEVHYYSATQKSWKVQQGFSAILQAAGKLQADYYRDTTSESEFLKPRRGQNDPSYSITPQASLYLSWSHLYQPDTRTYYIASITPQISLDDVRTKNAMTDEWNFSNNTVRTYLTFDFHYYKWFNQNLGLNIRSFARVSHNRDNAGPDPLNKPTTRYGLEINHNISAGLTYQLY